MITSLQVTNDKDESLLLTVRSPENSGFFIKNIEGLQPTKATINIDESISNGGVFNSSRVIGRNILIDLGYYDHSIDAETLRYLSYKYFPVNKLITLRVSTDLNVCDVSGYVESNDVYIFSSQEGSKISVVCPEAFITGVDVFEIELTGISGAFEFPLENQGLSPAIILGQIYEDQQTAYINYSGTYETGVILTATFTGIVTDPSFAEVLKNQLIFLNSAKVTAITGSNFSNGDIVTVSTKQNQKFATLKRGTTTYDILTALFIDDTIEWVTLTPGDNYIKYDAVSGVANMSATVKFNILYGGI